MELTKLKIDEFIDLLASGTPAPGGGSAAALVAAAGAGLVSMVAGLTIGREKYKAHEELAREVLERATEMKDALLSDIDRDTAAYNAVNAVFSMPKTTDEEKTERKQAMQTALKAATETPFEVMLHSLAALECAEKLLGHSNPNAVSDLGVAALNLKSALQAAWLNVLTNLGGITDDGFVEEYRRRGSEILEIGIAAADKLYAAVEKGMERNG